MTGRSIYSNVPQIPFHDIFFRFSYAFNYLIATLVNKVKLSIKFPLITCLNRINCVWGV